MLGRTCGSNDQIFLVVNVFFVEYQGERQRMLSLAIKGVAQNVTPQLRLEFGSYIDSQNQIRPCYVLNDELLYNADI